MILEIKDIKIDRKQVLKFLGYGNKEPVPIILKKVNEEIETSKDLFQPNAFIKEFQIYKDKDGRINLGNDYSIESKYLAEELVNIDIVYLSLYTIGSKIQERIDEYLTTNIMMGAMILDKIGVVGLDNIKSQIKEEIGKIVFPLNISTELYPGQKDFHISNQKLIFGVFNQENNIINISKHYQFDPIKTVGVLFGIGRDLDKYNMCDRCDNKCDYGI